MKCKKIINNLLKIKDYFISNYKRIIRNILILIIPFAVMIITNEFVRSNKKEGHYSYMGVRTINPDTRSESECSWACHNYTPFCQKLHVKILKPVFRFTDPLYYGVINLLKGTGNYRLANIIVFVILIPFLIFWFLIRSFDMQIEINKLKKK